jgi:hypothetical protein
MSPYRAEFCVNKTGVNYCATEPGGAKARSFQYFIGSYSY